VPHFRGEALRDPRVHGFAARIRIEPDGNTDENALDPQHIGVTLRDGTRHEIHLPHTYGHPAVPLTAAENEEKFFRCCRHAVPPVPEARATRIRDLVAGLDTLQDVATLARAVAFD
jgi:2-methylcitrate dehydratase PrpD